MEAEGGATGLKSPNILEIVTPALLRVIKNPDNNAHAERGRYYRSRARAHDKNARERKSV